MVATVDGVAVAFDAADTDGAGIATVAATVSGVAVAFAAVDTEGAGTLHAAATTDGETVAVALTVGDGIAANSATVEADTVAFDVADTDGAGIATVAVTAAGVVVASDVADTDGASTATARATTDAATDTFDVADTDGAGTLTVVATVDGVADALTADAGLNATVNAAHASLPAVDWRNRGGVTAPTRPGTSTLLYSLRVEYPAGNPVSPSVAPLMTRSITCAAVSDVFAAETATAVPATIGAANDVPEFPVVVVASPAFDAVVWEPYMADRAWSVACELDESFAPANV